ncbi:MAG TPA: FtsQ-type POTRA domain-containing protein [Candidatus Limnocylindrales bacterium]|nr:FtsQ-type POTRA domain-containing protein [Candidatus Limnocylindrales bacterium]
MFDKVIFFVQGMILLMMALCVYLYMGNSPHFEVSSIKVKGNIFLSSSEVIKKAGIQLHTNILKIKPEEIKNRLDQEVWIKRATIRRELPNRIIIELQEREPFMIWVGGTKQDGRRYLVDREGVLLKEVQEGEEVARNLPIFTTSSLIPLTSRESEPEMVYVQKIIPEIAKILQEDIFLFKKIKEIHLSGTGSLTLVPDTGTPEIRVHLLDYQRNLEYFKRLLPQLDVTHLEYVDLRFKKRVVIKPNNS